MLNKSRGIANVSLDLIIPVFNESEVISKLIERLQLVFNPADCLKAGLAQVGCIFIDDGSQDNSFDLLSGGLKKIGRGRVIRFSRNFGHQAAVTAGLEVSTADLCAIIDADLQDPPELIFEMIKKWREGFDVIFGQRMNRKENVFRVFSHWLFYRIYSSLSPIEIPLDSGDFCLISSKARSELNRLPEKLRFVRGLRTWVGFRQIGIYYDRPERAKGVTKYGLKALYQLATDGIASMSLRPLQVAQVLAFTYFTISIFLISLQFLRKKTLEKIEPGDLLTVTVASNGIILFCIYILGAYLGRTYLEVKGRPCFIVQEVIEME